MPLRQQLTTTECGAACLAMMLSYFGRATTVSECRSELLPGRDGLSVDKIAQVAVRHGLDATVTAEPPEGAAILFWRGGHFVVQEKRSAYAVHVADPASGRRTLTPDEFSKGYAGVALTLRPNATFERRRARLREAPAVRYFAELLRLPGSRARLTGVAASALALLATGLMLPLLLWYVVDVVMAQRPEAVTAVLLGASLAVASFAGLMSFARSRLLASWRAKATTAHTASFMTHLLRQPLTFFLLRSRGDLMMRLSSVATSREVLTGQPLVLAIDTVIAAGYVALLLLLAPTYVALTVLLGLAQVGVAGWSQRKLRLLTRGELAAMTGEQAKLSETIDAILPVKANGAESSALMRWKTHFDRYQEMVWQRSRATALAEGARVALNTLAPLALLVLGVALVRRGDVTLGQMLAANLVALAALAPVGNLASLGQSWQLARVQLERMYDVLDSPAEPIDGAQLAGRTPLAVELSGINAGYSGNELVLQDISLRLPPGRKVAVVGRTGSGKTTLALVVLGLLTPSAGRITVDGQALSEVDLPQLRTTFGAVLQNLSLFSGSIADNIALGRESLTQQDIERAARTAALHDEVLAMPMGYQTQVGEGGQALSAGQRQRVALARALVHRPRLLVLDEATSQLDPLTERAVDEALDRLEVTRLVISHRMSAVANADEIVVLERGSVIERGQHEELLDRQGHYYGLFAGVVAPHQKVPPQKGEMDVRRTASLEGRGLPG